MFSYVNVNKIEYACYSYFRLRNLRELWRISLPATASGVHNEWCNTEIVLSNINLIELACNRIHYFDHRHEISASVRLRISCPESKYVLFKEGNLAYVCYSYTNIDFGFYRNFVSFSEDCALRAVLWKISSITGIKFGEIRRSWPLHRSRHREWLGF
jgi:hypothetical protein